MRRRDFIKGMAGLLAEFTQGLSELGWIEGRNLRMAVRWAPARTDVMRPFAKELVDLQPDVILANSTPVTAALKRETLTIPIVFAVVADPVGSGFVASVPRQSLGSAQSKRQSRASGLSCSRGWRPTSSGSQ